MDELDDQTQTALVHPLPPLYSEGSIGGATFLGGPLAGGMLVRRNFLNLGNQKMANLTLGVAIVATVVIFGGLLALPDAVTDAIPGPVIPAAYIAAILGFVKLHQGAELSIRKDGGGPYISGWKAAGIGFANLVLLIGLLFGGALFLAPGVDADAYNAGLAKVQANETKALELFKMKTDDEAGLKTAVEFIEKTGLPTWKENLVILDEMDKAALEDKELLQQDASLREYTTLRIESYELLKKSIEEDSDAYDLKIQELVKKMDAIKL